MLTDNLVSYWKFDEGSGTTANDSINSNHGTIGNATWTTGKINSGLHFDGDDDYVQVADNANLRFSDTMTISVWFKEDSLDNPAENKYYVAKPNNYFIRRNTGSKNVTAGIYKSTGSYTSSYAYTITDTNWHNFVVTVDATANLLTTYVDGNLIGSKEFGAEAIATTTDNLFLGAWSATVYSMLGNLDEVAIWSRALIPSEVSTLYKNGSGLQYPFNPEMTGISSTTGLSSITF